MRVCIQVHLSYISECVCVCVRGGIVLGVFVLIIIIIIITFATQSRERTPRSETMCNNNTCGSILIDRARVRIRCGTDEPEARKVPKTENRKTSARAVGVKRFRFNVYRESVWTRRRRDRRFTRRTDIV